jgi:hypothetical protein
MITGGGSTNQCATSSIRNPPHLHHVKVGGQKETGGTKQTGPQYDSGAKALGVALIGTRQTGGPETGHLVTATFANYPGISPNTAQHHSRGSPRISRTTFISNLLIMGERRHERRPLPRRDSHWTGQPRPSELQPPQPGFHLHWPAQCPRQEGLPPLQQGTPGQPSLFSLLGLRRITHNMPFHTAGKTKPPSMNLQHHHLQHHPHQHRRNLSRGT